MASANRRLIALCISLAIAACGQTGDLRLPDEKAPSEQQQDQKQDRETK